MIPTFSPFNHYPITLNNPRHLGRIASSCNWSHNQESSPTFMAPSNASKAARAGLRSAGDDSPCIAAIAENRLCGPTEWCTNDFKGVLLIPSDYLNLLSTNRFTFNKYMQSTWNSSTWFHKKPSSQTSNHHPPRMGFGADVDHSSSTLDKICCKVSSRCFTNFFRPADRCVAAAVMASATSLP